MHLNVPDLGDQGITVVLKRARFTVIMLFAPELIIGGQHANGSFLGH
jgi:hypothetical protein